jgi:hypothetical protein
MKRAVIVAGVALMVVAVLSRKVGRAGAKLAIKGATAG